MGQRCVSTDARDAAERVNDEAKARVGAWMCVLKRHTRNTGESSPNPLPDQPHFLQRFCNLPILREILSSSFSNIEKILYLCVNML